MPTLVTGATGLLGSHLVRQLLQNDREVRILLEPGLDNPWPKGVEVVKGDIRNLASVGRACQGVDTVFHLAALISTSGGKRGRVWDVNVEGTRIVGQAALFAGVSRFIHTSSIHAYDLYTASHNPLTESHPRVGPGHFAYDYSKWAGEQEIQKLVTNGLRATIVNPTGIIGPDDPGPSRTGRFFHQMFRGKLSLTVGGGFDFVDVRDVVAGIFGAERFGGVGENYILSGHWSSMKGLATAVGKVTGVQNRALVVPAWLPYLGVPFFTLGVMFSRADPLCTHESLSVVASLGGRDISCEKAKSELHYHRRALGTTIADMYQCYLRQEDRKSALPTVT